MDYWRGDEATLAASRRYICAYPQELTTLFGKGGKTGDFPRVGIGPYRQALAHFHQIAGDDLWTTIIQQVDPRYHFPLFVDDHNCIGSGYQRYEEMIAFMVSNYLRPGDLALDIGANLGYYTVLMGLSVLPGGRVLALEPDPHNFDILKKNILLNGIPGVEVLRTAVGADRGETRLYRNPANKGDHRIWAQAGAVRDCLTVPLCLLDDILDPAIPLRLLKIDVQGAENQVLQGARKTIGRQKHMVIALECWPEGIRQSGSSMEEMRHLLYEEFHSSVFLITRVRYQNDPEGGTFGSLTYLPKELFLRAIEWNTAEEDVDYVDLWCWK